MKMPLASRELTEPIKPSLTVNRHSLEVRKAIRLNLGGRDTRIPGFLNVDLYNGKDVDIEADVSNLHMIDPNSVEEIYASNILEHFSHTRTLFVLEEWYRVLKPGGTLYLSVPDFDAIVKIYQKYGMVQWVTNLLWGDQSYPLAFHYVTFNFATLANLVHRSGFRAVKRVKFLTKALKDCSSLIDNKEGQPVCLNIECIK